MQGLWVSSNWYIAIDEICQAEPVMLRFTRISKRAELTFQAFPLLCGFDPHKMTSRVTRTGGPAGTVGVSVIPIHKTLPVVGRCRILPVRWVAAAIYQLSRTDEFWKIIN